MTLVEHAERELALRGEDPELIANLVATVRTFAEFGHSGGSAPFAIDYLTRLLRYEPLTPITSDPAEWIDRSEMSGYPIWQNVRDGRAMSEDGGKTWSLVGEPPGPMNGAALYAEGLRLLAVARERTDALSSDVPLGYLLGTDSVITQLSSLASAHFAAAQAAALASSLHPQSISWQTALGLREDA